MGEVTRKHDDIDLAAWNDERDLMHKVLESAGWRHTPVENEVVGTRYQWGSAQIEITWVVSDDDGRILIPFPQEAVVWSSEPFGDDR